MTQQGGGGAKTPASSRDPASPERVRRRKGRQPPLGGWGSIVLGSLVLAPLTFIAFREGGLDLVVRQQFGVALLWGLGLALAFGLLPRARPGRSARRIIVLFPLLIGWTALSLLWAESAEAAFADLSRLLLYGGAAAAVLLIASRRSWTAVASAVCVVMLGLPLLSLVSYAVPGSLSSGPLDSVPRLSYPLGYWNALACWSAMAVVVGLTLSVEVRDRTVRSLSLAAAPVAGLVLYLTLSRGGVLALLVGLVALMLSSRRPLTLMVRISAVGALTAGLILFVRAHPELETGVGSAGAGLLALTALAAGAAGMLGAARRSRRRREGGGGVLPSGASGRAVVAAVVTVLVAAWVVAGAGPPGGAGDPAPLENYPVFEGDPAARLTSLEGSRTEIWGSASRAWASRPLLGIGPGSFGFWWTRDVPGGEQLSEPHALYLGQLAELGIPGLLLLLGVLGGLLVAAAEAVRSQVRSGSRGLALALTVAFGVYLAQATVDWLWESVALTLVTLVGVSAVIGSRSEARRARTRGGWSGRRIAAAAAALLCGAALIPGAVATERTRASLQTLAVGRDAEAEAIADQAVTAEPWAASPYAARALARVVEANLTGARADALAAVAREPTNWRHAALLAAVESMLGDESAAQAALAEARRLNPALALDLGDLPDEIR